VNAAAPQPGPAAPIITYGLNTDAPYQFDPVTGTMRYI
jgi:hypothetical protein